MKKTPAYGWPTALTLAALFAALLTASPLPAAEPFSLPPIEHLERLENWRAGVAAADAQERPLQIVCIGDSNTENPACASELRRLLQGCYGERGIGYHSLGNRTVLPESPQIERTGTWDLLRDAPNGPPPPRFALDGIWCRSSDPNAEISVEFTFGSWDKPAYQLARAYNVQQRVRIHYQVGPDLGSFAIVEGSGQLSRIDCMAGQPGYAVSEAFLCDGFRIAGVQGKVVLLGFDAERAYYLQGKPVLKGGVLVHALGKSWGRTEEPALVEESAYAAFFGAIRPDLITILLGTNDQRHYPVLRPSTRAQGRPTLAVPRLAAVELAGVAAALAAETAQGIWLNADRIAEVRLAIAGEALALHARVADAQYLRMFATRGDAGAFRDASLSAEVNVVP